MAALTITAASVAFVSGTKLDVTAGETITAGMLVYMDTTDSNKYKGVDADVEASAVAAGIALNGASSGQPLRIQTSGVITIGATIAVGTVYYAGLTAGNIGPLADIGPGDYVSIVGVGITAANMRMIVLNSGVALP